MAIRITNMKPGNGKRAINMKQVEIAELIKKLMKKEGIKCNITISRYYYDRWYSIKVIKRCIETDMKQRDVNTKGYKRKPSDFTLG